jgi:hypothetical protein
VRRIGILTTYAADDPAGQARLLAFAQELAQSGWIDGRNLRIDVRWGGVDAPSPTVPAATLRQPLSDSDSNLLSTTGRVAAAISQIIERRPATTIGHVNHVDAGHHLEQLAGAPAGATGTIRRTGRDG